MAPSVYSGPLALAQSKHASAQQRKTVPTAVCPAIMSPVLSSIETIATKTQVAATDLTLQNAGTQLALLQGNALKQEVEKHAARFTNTISTTVMNTRQLLELLRKSMEKENVTDAKIIEHLWAELEQLFTAAQETRAAIPTFIEKQRNSTSLYYASMMNETMQENQEELNIQNKKLNIQSSLILEQQEAFNDYKLQTVGKLQELQNLHDQVSRLTLEKGHIRTELEESNKRLDEEKAAKQKVHQACDSLRHEQEALLTSKTNLQAECNTLRMELSELQEKNKNTEQQTVGRLTAELQAKVDELAKVVQKITELNAEIRGLKDETTNAKMEAEKLKAENRTMSEKYKMLSGAHGVAFTKTSEQTKRIESLTNDIERIKTENSKMESQVAECSGFRQQNVELVQAKSALLGQLEQLSKELKSSKENSQLVKVEMQGLTEDLKHLKNEHNTLTAEKQEYLSKRAEAEKAIQALTILKNENSNLKNAMDELKSEQTDIALPEPRSLDGEQAAQSEKIRSLEEENKSLEAAVQEWTSLAKRSYNEYKEMLPTYRQANHYRQEAIQKEDIIENLKLEISTLKAYPSNNTNATSDSVYWKNKYESLLASIGG